MAKACQQHPDPNKHSPLSQLLRSGQGYGQLGQEQRDGGYTQGTLNAFLPSLIITHPFSILEHGELDEILDGGHQFDGIPGSCSGAYAWPHRLPD